MIIRDVFYSYVEEVDPNLTCAICQSALVDPVTTSSCKHTFCRDCITRALAHSPTCPIDRSALTLSSLRDTEPLVQLMLDELEVTCGAEGCGKVMQRGLLLSHIRTCARAIVTCGDDECGLSMARHRMPHHRAYECFHRRMACTKCGTTVTFKEATGKHACHGSEHGLDCHCCDACGQTLSTSPQLHRWICPAALVPCTQRTHGCSAVVKRTDLESHQATCPFEALSVFFAANDARLAALEKRQDELGAENDFLRSQIWAMRRASIVPRALWADDSGVSSFADISSAPTPPIPDPSPDRVPSPIPIPASDDTEIDQDSTPTNAPASTTPRSRAGELSPSLAPSEIIVESPPLSRVPTPLLSPPPRMSYADWVHRRLPPPGAYDSEATASLRAAMVHLAAGLDWAERRNEVRSMTESLRVLEEVAALRAIVRPMRMQVLADRPGSPQVARSPHEHPHQWQQSPRASTPLALPTPPLSTDHSSEIDVDMHISVHTSVTEDEEFTGSIRESVVFSASDAHNSASSSSVSTGNYSCMPSGGRPAVPREWTGRPCAFPDGGHQVGGVAGGVLGQRHRATRSSSLSNGLGSISGLGASLLGRRRERH